MKRCMIIISILFVLFLPSIFVSLNNERMPQESLPIVFSSNMEEATQQIVVMDGSVLKKVDFDDYVLCVILGEMPGDFDIEALKAQAVATRTYSLRRVKNQSKHNNSDVCTDSSCCQAYIEPEIYLANGGTESNLEKFRMAVHDTAGEVLTYCDELIEATYFSCSGGVTEDAVAVWGSDVPYLKSVISPGEEDTKHFSSTLRYTKQEFLAKLGLPETLVLSEDSIILTYTEGNGVSLFSIGSVELTGTQVRSLLELPSTAFSISIEGQNVTIEVRGNGHRVGMSQYGAEAMAVSGKNYEQILMHYYPGTQLVKFSEERMKAVFDKEGNL